PFRIFSVENLLPGARLIPVLTPKGFYSTARGRAAHPGIRAAPTDFYPAGVVQAAFVQPLRGKSVGVGSPPGVRCATLGCGVQPLRGKEKALPGRLSTEHFRFNTGNWRPG